MHVRMGLIKKKEGWTDEAFRVHWREKHGLLALQAVNLREYWQNTIVERFQRGIEFPRGPWDFDGISQLRFDDAAQADSAFKSASIGDALVMDEARFLSGLHIVTAEQRVVIPVPAEAERRKLAKRMSILKRRPDVSESGFRREWVVHGELVKKMPGVGAYRQNVVIAREVEKGMTTGYDDLPIDGVVELWFESPETLGAAFASPAGQETMAHAKTFLAEITAFGVLEHRVG